MGETYNELNNYSWLSWYMQPRDMFLRYWFSPVPKNLQVVTALKPCCTFLKLWGRTFQISITPKTISSLHTLLSTLITAS